MAWGKESLITALEEVWQQSAALKNGAMQTAVESIIRENLERGRINKWLGHNPNRAPLDYVLLVTQTYERTHEQIYQLQEERTEAAWAALFAQLRRWAYNYLLGKAFKPGPMTQELAVGYATEAALTILSARFTYDVTFEAWACTLVQHVCRHQIRKARTQSRIPDENLIPLEEDLAHLEQSAGHQQAQEYRLELLDAIEQLPQKAWQQVILLRYFAKLSSAEIAQELNKTPSAIYNAHFKAIAALRKILLEKGYIDE